MPYGKLSEFCFDENKNWSAYVRLVKQFILLNDIKTELHVATLLTHVGAQTYQLMCDLCAPDFPEDKTFEQLIELVAGHLEPKRSEIAERHTFRQRRQVEGESIGAFLQSLKHLATHCNFKATLEVNIRDQFVSGLRSEEMRSRLFAEPSLDYKKAVELALALEAAERHAVEAAAGGAPEASGSLAGLTPAALAAPMHRLVAGQQLTRRTCWRCGKGAHAPNKSVDSSSYGLGAVLSQLYSDNTERIVCCASRTLNEAERRYSQIDKEALAIVYENSEIENEKPYFNRKDSLHLDHGCIVWGYRIVIPRTLRSQILDELHAGHVGVVRMKQIARNYVWWPNIDADIEARARACIPCTSVLDAPPAAAPRNGVKHILTAPYHPSSNGAAENAVKNVKKVLKKAALEGEDTERALCKFLLQYRNTEHTITKREPAVAMFGRTLRTRFDLLRGCTADHVEEAQKTQVRLAKTSAERQVVEGDNVLVRNYSKSNTSKWQPGIVVERTGAVTYKIQTGDTISTKHIDQILPLRKSNRFSLPGPIENDNSSMAKPEIDNLEDTSNSTPAESETKEAEPAGSNAQSIPATHERSPPRVKTYNLRPRPIRTNRDI
ncbi:uncharacterized protein LOC119191026 [Manduca sexta]|uniref:uncharacterized protein LOC119191026 n=1 Tax=Manduca sexta TaxID=7130 RepID=UPI00189067CD|nr:uncharacterized protein LOC119191026 [Manduca sexta]